MLFLLISSLFAQGQVFWQENGVCVCNRTFQGGGYVVSIVSDSCGGAIVIWVDTRGNQSSIYAQRIDKNGNCLWMSNGVLLRNNTWFPNYLFSVSDGKGGVIATWVDYSAGPYPIQVTAQRVDSSGNICWGTNGVVVAGADRNLEYYPMIETDGRSGAIVGWIVTNFDNYYKDSVYVQRIDSAGQIRWTSGGVSVNTDSCFCYNTPPSLTIDGLNGVIITWSDGRENENFGVFAQRIDSSGNILWRHGGVPICTTLMYHRKSFVTKSQFGNCLVSWSDDRQGNWDVYAQLIDPNGQILWSNNGELVCSDTASQWIMALGESFENCILIWSDSRNGLWDIYAQKLNILGLRLWDSLGVRIGQTRYDEPKLFSIISDDRGGAIIAWQYWGINGWDIYCQRIDSTGRQCWSDTGLPVCSDPELQRWDPPAITTDGANGSIIAWGDDRPSGTNASVYSQRVGDAVGIEKNDDRITLDCKLQISPNPVKSALRVRVPWASFTPNASRPLLKIFDVSGKLIKENEILRFTQNDKTGEITISLKGINPGIYFLQLGTKLEKFLVVK